VPKTKELKKRYLSEEAKNQPCQFWKEPSHASGSSFERDRSRGRFATPADFPLHDGTHPLPGATRTTLRFGMCPPFKGHSLSRLAKP
jgi:hypothetical protein